MEESLERALSATTITAKIMRCHVWLCEMLIGCETNFSLQTLPPRALRM